jgi:alcohol dehydrogenase class IV
MVHTLESFMTHKSTSITRTLSSNAFKLIYTNLPLALAQPSEPQTRQGVLLGAYFAAAALFNSGSGIAGGMSYPIGVHHHVPHGIAGGIVLPSVVRFNIDAGWYGFAELHDLISPNWSLTACEKADAFGQLLDQWYREMQVPTDYGQWGLTSHDLSRLSEYMLPLQAAFDQNPVAFSAKSDAPALLAKHLS